MSFLRHLYYEFKPYLPVSARMAFRRGIARRTLKRSQDVWPIKAECARAPINWPGWPRGKKFALVLTHDVEGPLGLQNCEKLAALEKELGFRSSFNFIPEGDYQTPQSLRNLLVAEGFEVGVHDLHHDGKLYRARSDFKAAAKKINAYLDSWNAVGFRSGFMHHNLDWLHDLDIAYDMSTFDTDPFEPQPDGVDTIFPFWVPAPGSNSTTPVHGTGFRSGYVELPYTLPQDSTLFLLLRHNDIEVWKRKIDWIASHQGMALVNVHPDYINFEGRDSSSVYPVSLYRDFLEYLQKHYYGEFWLVLPRELASFVRLAPEELRNEELQPISVRLAH